MIMTDFTERQKIVWQNMFYSIQRIDLLIISVSGAGIYLCLESLKFMHTTGIPINCSIKVSAGFFVFAITTNFISQFISYQANKYDFLSCSESKKEQQDDDSKRKQIIYDDKSDTFNKINNFFNYTSAILMFSGLFICFMYFIMTF